MNQQDIFASAQILTLNPILQESENVKVQYFLYLRKLIHSIHWNKRKYIRAQLTFYRDKLCGSQTSVRICPGVPFPVQLAYLLPFDFAAITGIHPKVMCTEKLPAIIRQIASDFQLPKDAVSFLNTACRAVQGDEGAWDQVLKSKYSLHYRVYLSHVRSNILFMRERPYKILFTATMSAGKSTLINALVGKNISLAQNMACTSKIHTIISKPFEDGVTSEYDHDLLMAATKEDLLTDNDENQSSKITVGTCLNGFLSGQRVIFYDSPGVNSSENTDHAKITYQMIRSKRYKLMIYVLNATQLATTDEELHLKAVAERIGRTNILFVMNRVDHLISEDDDIASALAKQREFLTAKGFRNPVICPVSARAAYLAKKSQQEELSRIERRELENNIDKFQEQSLSSYYEKSLGCAPIPDSGDEAQQLLKNCGLSYLELIIKYIKDGGKINGTGVC